MKTVKKNEEVTVRFILGETAEVLVTRLDNGNFMFNCDAYVVGEPTKGGFYHLRQAREIIPGKKLGNNIKFWPRMRRALQVAGVKPINIPGGGYPLHYRDEMVIPDYAMSGAYYFVIKRSDIEKYLAYLPLDNAGKEKAEQFAQQQAAAEAEAYRQEHDPKCIAERIGDLFYKETHYGHIYGWEFFKVTVISDDNTEFSVIYQSERTDLIWNGCCNISKVVCEAPETGIEFLSGCVAGKLDPRTHGRLKKIRHDEWRRFGAYLLPNPKLATKVCDEYGWSSFFNHHSDDAEMISPELIVNAKKIVLEGYDLYDNLIKERFVYDNESKRVSKEYLHNSVWRTEETEE